MRLHRLRAQAFGPFANAVEVDFDELSQAGLFLLSGATGAGKTSVLDAVCFALYGDVPGDRSTAKRLRSDQAAPGAVPRVELEVTVGGRRFWFVRSPAWERLKKRGSGTTTEPAKVTVSELVGGEWRPLSSRLDETGDLVARVVGLTQTQFTQVAMLPQGRFQAFLRARSDERHRLLQQLFRTGRFEAVEAWLRERRLELGRRDTVARERVADVVSRASETAGVEPFELESIVDDVLVRAWLIGLHADAERSSVASRRDLAFATGHEVEHRQRLELARADLERRERQVAARHELDELLTRAEAHAADQTRLDLARRAAHVVPWHRQALTQALRAEEAAAESVDACRRVEHHLGRVVPPEALGALADEAVSSTAVATALRPRAARVGVLSEQVTVGRRRRDHLVSDLARVQHELAVRPDRLRELVAEVVTTEERAGQVDPLTAAAQQVRVRLDAHQRVAQLHPEAAAAREQWLATKERLLVLKDELVVLRMARIDGMAAELALALAVGASCPVCGSADHPAKARPTAGTPDGDAEKAAAALIDDLAIDEHARELRVRELESSLATARAEAGPVPAEILVGELATLQVSLGEAHRAAGRLPDLQSRLTVDRRAIDDLERRATVLLADRDRADADLARLTDEHAGLSAEVERALQGHRDLESLLAHHQRTVALCRRALSAADEARACAAALDAAQTAARAAAHQSGFTDSGAALVHAVDTRALTRLEDSVDRYQRRLAALTEVLRASELVDDAPLPDLDVLDAAHLDALDGLRVAAAELALHTSRVQRLDALLVELGTALGAWAPLRRDLELTSRLSSFVDGRSSDNRLRMRLSAFVLAYRLGQVVDAANERLARMSDQRYSLEHTAHRGAGETRGGLSLLVRDDWSGESRDPATLSGGETFVVSLALALGLADVIAHEAGGASLDTLFVDEGFGSLDADTLDDVMDTLDALRDGGRVVGVVSHVAEMRDRIPTQLVVAKSRTGSTVSLRR